MFTAPRCRGRVRRRPAPPCPSCCFVASARSSDRLPPRDRRRGRARCRHAPGPSAARSPPRPSLVELELRDPRSPPRPSSPPRAPGHQRRAIELALSASAGSAGCWRLRAAFDAHHVRLAGVRPPRENLERRGQLPCDRRRGQDRRRSTRSRTSSAAHRALSAPRQPAPRTIPADLVARRSRRLGPRRALHPPREWRRSYEVELRAAAFVAR